MPTKRPVRPRETKRRRGNPGVADEISRLPQNDPGREQAFLAELRRLAPLPPGARVNREAALPPMSKADATAVLEYYEKHKQWLSERLLETEYFRCRPPWIQAGMVEAFFKFFGMKPPSSGAIRLARYRVRKRTKTPT